MNKLPFLMKERTSFSHVYRNLSLFSRKTSFYHAPTYKPQNSLLPLTRSSSYVSERHESVCVKWKKSLKNLFPDKTPQNSLLFLTRSSSYVSERHESVCVKWKKSLRNLFPDKTKVRIAGYLVYEKIADDIEYKSFFEAFKLADTFQSWFLFIQIHVWMMTVVTISERHGREFRNSLIDAMWNDVDLRIDQMTNMRSALKKKHLKDLVSQFQAAVIAFDEGILSDDDVLAAAAWRTLFSCQLVDPELLENIVLYVRRQIAHLDSEPSDKIIMFGSVTFLPLQTILSECKE